MNGKMNLESRINREHIGLIKPMLAQGLNETEIGLRLSLTPETVSRVINTWAKTQDFKDWIAECWLSLYGKVASEHPVEAFRQVTRLFSLLIAARPDEAEELKRIEVCWLGQVPKQNSSTCNTEADSDAEVQQQ